MARKARKAVFPFLRPDPERLYAEPWFTYGGQEVGDAIPDWDYQTEIHLVRNLVVDTPSIMQDCALGDDAVLRLSVIAKSGGSGEKSSCFSQLIQSTGHSEEIVVDMRIQDKTLAGTLVLSTLLTLVSAGRGASNLSPQECGNVLWEEHKEILIEGSGARFPIETLDFTEAAWLPADAGWFLDWSPEFLEQPLLGTVRLLINSRHSVVIKAVASHEPDDTDKAVLSGIYYETGKSLILGSLTNEEFLEARVQYKDDSVGRLVDSMINRYFSGESRQALLQRAEGDTEEFNAALRDRLGLFFPAKEAD